LFLNRSRCDAFCSHAVSAVVVLALSSCLPLASNAQFLRIGPFDFEVGTELEGIYTTNVEQERPSETDADREDWYYVISLFADSEASLSPRTIVSLDTGLSIERHLNRPDLDNTQDPFGRFRLDVSTELGANTTVFGDVSYEQRHQDEDFKDADQDTTTIGAAVEYKLFKRLSPTYTYERKKEELMDEDDVVVAGGDDDEWEVTQNIALKFTIFERPKLTYSFGYEKDSTKQDKWLPKHTVDLTDDLELFNLPNLTLSVGASYTYEKDDTVEHEISRTAHQSLNVAREPVDTLGSTSDTDNTKVSYNLTKEDLFIYNLVFTFTASYEIDDPLETDAETEKIWTYDVGLVHSRALTRKLSRSLAYNYSYEDSDQESEILDEHRVTLSFTYMF